MGDFQEGKILSRYFPHLKTIQMKRMITIGVCLVTAAIVYGFVDYLKTDKQQLQRMYGDEPAAGAAPAVKAAAAPVEAADPVAEARLPLKASADNTTGKGIKRRPKRIKADLYSRAALEERFIPLDSAKETPAAAAKAYPVPPPPPPPVVQPPAPAKTSRLSPSRKADEPVFKKVDASLFSRSSLKRRKPPVVVDTVVAVAEQKN